FIAEVDKQLSPVVAFNSIAKGVMGKYSRRSSSKQVEQFTEAFKSSLISFYGKALLKLDDTQLVIESVKPIPESVLKDYEAGNARLIPVDMSVRTPTTVVALSYSMIYMDGRWKLRNIIVDGINIGIQFRNQFADAMMKYNDIQYVIDNWSQIMEGSAVVDQKS
ncbi:MAG: MlaC/ttg2D family ABC transporter substrate-binding protein, partial [Endozoicomonas sp.]